ncbi:MAG: ATP synthase F1 subunit epsilon [Gemmatimonadetes bacterium]|nr:ATP synthase F1 subunit epsilon [Gemmatimonadota bacterium]
MHVTVIAPESAVFEGAADSLIAPAFDGEVGILPRHAPFMTLLGDGLLTVRHGETSHAFYVRGGFLQVVRDNVRVVAEHARAEE